MKLNNNNEIPQLGLGTYLLTPIQAKASVIEAISDGYKLIDTANAYCNERAVGKGIKDSKAKREELFISSKLWPSEYENPNAVDETLNRLQLSYIDLLFIHQPSANWRKGYEQLIKAYKEGKIKNIGVSNFEGEYITALLKEYDIRPQVI